MRLQLAGMVIGWVMAVMFTTALDTPQVLVDGATHKAVACETVHMSQPIKITDPRCKAVLAGSYDEVVVNPGWLP